MKFSKFGTKLTKDAGILQLMDDLGKAMASDSKKYMLGGGNPAHIKEIQEIYREQMKNILKDNKRFENIISNYDTPQGYAPFIKEFVNFLNKEYDFGITEENVAITPGSQTSFFYLFNLLAGTFEDGSKKKILLPLSPEYIGYEDQGIEDDIFTAIRSKISLIDKHSFKYQIDFDNLTITDDINAICVSRPTNPTGNVITDSEVEKLNTISKDNDIPLIIDNAYGKPFPNILFTQTKLMWEPNIILTMSLSKVGLPSARNGIVIARREIIKAITSLNAIVALASPNIGQAIITPLLKNSQIKDISKKYITSYYKKKSINTIRLIKKYFNDTIPYYIHISEGSIFLWIWFKDLPISSMKLYELLKEQSVIIVPGNYFFPGLNDNWQHKDECIRLNFGSANKEDMEKAIKIFASIINTVYEK